VVDVSSGAEEGIGLSHIATALVLAAEQEDGVTSLSVLDVASASGRLG